MKDSFEGRSLTEIMFDNKTERPTCFRRQCRSFSIKTERRNAFSGDLLEEQLIGVRNKNED